MASATDRLRNIGISAHIDSGKTTLTERILFYTRRIRAMHEVRGSDGVGATMDSMDLERERGITIASAATHCRWLDHHVNIIDTPGHVDFTVEVERSLRVLDGAVLVLCAVAGVQSQSYTVDRQMQRYRVPRIAFVNKCDRVGANPVKVRDQLRSRLNLNPVLLQLPLGLAEEHEGVIDLVEMEAVRFEGEGGERVARGPIPDDRLAEAEAEREHMLDAVSMFSDELTEAILEETLQTEQIHEAIRSATLARQITPVLLGSAYKNKGVQPLLDAVVRYLPGPADVQYDADDLRGGSTPLSAENPQAPPVALAFKLEDGRYGQLTYVRVYQGRLQRDDTIVNVRTSSKHRVGRLVRMHADEMEEIRSARAGDIVALFGIDCFSGDTFTDGSMRVAMSPIHVPDPVISLSVTPADHRSETGLAKALSRFAKEDPTFHVRVDPDSGETLISGMGELHLDVYIERMRREYGAEVTTSPPQVAYREALSRSADFDHTHRKQTGGAGQYGRVIGRIEPAERAEFEFVDQVKGGAIPRPFIPSVQKGFASMLAKGPLIGFPLTAVRVVLTDGKAHAVDSSEMAFAEAARGAWRATCRQAAPRILEPVMRVVAEGPADHAGTVMSTLMQRRGTIVGSQEEDGAARVEAEVPLAEMFGYATTLRSATQGQASFTMEFARYLPVPSSISEELIANHAQGRN